MAISYLRVVSRVRSFYVENTRQETVMAGPFPSDGKARNVLVELDGTRYEVRVHDTITGDWQGCDTRWGVYDSHEKRFIGLASETAELFETADAAGAAYVANMLNRHQRNESRFQQYRERHPVTGEYR